MIKIKVVALLGALAVSGLASADLKTGLTAYYPFNGNANDRSGNKNHGIVNGAVLTEDRFGNLNSAYSFDGKSSYIDLVGKPIAQQGKTPRSMFVWCKTTDKKAYQRVIATGTTGFNQAFNILLWENGRPGIMGYANDFYIKNQSIADGKWHFIGATYNGSKLSLWVDGILKGKKSIVFNTTGNDNFIGRSNDYYQEGTIEKTFFNGDIDDIRIYNRALSTSEVQQLYRTSQLVNGFVEGYSTLNVTCANKTSGQTVTFVSTNTASSSWNCEQKGLAINFGDQVDVTLSGKAHQ